VNVFHEERQLGAEQRRALKFLADVGQQGCTGVTLLAHWFSIGMLDDLVWHGLATRHRETVRASRRKVSVARIRITDAGRRAIGAYRPFANFHAARAPTSTFAATR
jgi:hypothetical protein